MIKNVFKRMSRVRIIALGFAAVIAVGSLLLMLPFATRSGQSTSYIEALFTATSATCVTGLIVFDTFTHWTLFGQIVIMCLIQLGGIGFMTVITTVNIFLRHRIGLQSRMLVMESAGNISLSGIRHLVMKIIKGTVIFEGVGALLLAVRLIPRLGIGQGIFASVFHSVSAFCNAGFDVMGQIEPGSSMRTCVSDPIINITLMLLIIIGGIGFFVWSDVQHCGLHFKKYQLHTKLVLATTGILIAFSWVLFYMFEYDHAFADMSVPEKILASLFQAVTPRTAGFETVPMSSLSEPGNILTDLLMFIGGSPGSTAGGIKTTTIAVIFLSTLAYTQKDHDVTVFHFKIEEDMVRRASSIAFIYFSLTAVSVTIISAIEPYTMQQTLFEVISAVGTVGLTMGITPSLTIVSKILLIVLMYAGRLGALSFVLILTRKTTPALITRPTGKIMIG